LYPVASETLNRPSAAPLAALVIGGHPGAKPAAGQSICTVSRFERGPGLNYLEANVVEPGGKKMVMLAGPSIGAAVHLTFLCGAFNEGRASLTSLFTGLRPVTTVLPSDPAGREVTIWSSDLGERVLFVAARFSVIAQKKAFRLFVADAQLAADLADAFAAGTLDAKELP
jgi:hypothetical protein